MKDGELMDYTFQGASVKGERIMHTPSQFAKTNLIYLQEIGTSHYLSPHSSIRGTQNSFLFCLVTSGKGILEYQNTRYDLSPGDLFFINCKNPYTIASLKELWTICWIHFNGASLTAIQDKFVERCGAPCFHSSPDIGLQARHAELFRLAASSDYVKDMLIAEKLTGLITELMRHCWKHGSSQRGTSARRSIAPILDFINNHFEEETLSLEILAGQFNYNKFYLARRFKEECGMTVNQFIVQKKVTAAKHLLRFSDLNISEITKKCGFDDPNYFARVFKAVEGLPPTQFRKIWTAKELDS